MVLFSIMAEAILLKYTPPAPLTVVGPEFPAIRVFWMSTGPLPDAIAPRPNPPPITLELTIVKVALEKIALPL